MLFLICAYIIRLDPLFLLVKNTRWKESFQFKLRIKFFFNIIKIISIALVYIIIYIQESFECLTNHSNQNCLFIKYFYFGQGYFVLLSLRSLSLALLGYYRWRFLPILLFLSLFLGWAALAFLWLGLLLGSRKK